MSDWNNRIDQLLAERRPDSYEVDGGDEWLDDIAEEIADDIPEAEARSRLARTEVRRREKTKLQQTNKLLREIHKTGQLPLDWLDVLNNPLGVGKIRVALRAAAPRHFREFANEERRRAASDFVTRNESCEAAAWLADQMDAQGYNFGKDISL